MNIVKVKTKQIDSEFGSDDYPSYDCPLCPKGIVTIGMTSEIVIPKGILASDRVGDITLYHFTCDRCDFKILTTNYFDVSITSK